MIPTIHRLWKFMRNKHRQIPCIHTNQIYIQITETKQDEVLCFVIDCPIKSKANTRLLLHCKLLLLLDPFLHQFIVVACSAKCSMQQFDWLLTRIPAALHMHIYRRQRDKSLPIFATGCRANTLKFKPLPSKHHSSSARYNRTNSYILLEFA